VAPDPNSPRFEWQAEMPLLTNRFFLYDGGKLVFWTGIGVGVLMFFGCLLAGSLRSLPTLLGLFGAILLAMLFLFLLIALLFFGNRFPMSFTIGPGGIGWASVSRRARAANRIAVVAGIASGSLGGTGAGLLAVSQETGYLSWSEVRRIRPYPAERVITVMNNWRVVTRLYCTPDNYAYVARLADWYFTVTRPSAPAPPR
jgi:hypothetical protein